jgi:ubiquinone/menaquinone biosynthesis C-methylase UbiE
MPESKQQHEASLTTHTAANYQTHANFVYSDANTSPVLGLLNAQPGECIIDLGCGTGQVTVRIKALVGSAGQVWGVDSSENMVGRSCLSAA